MGGIRVEPDNNDIVVWKLDEETAPFVNSSTSTNAISQATSNLTTLSGTVLTQQPSIFAASGTNSAVHFTGNNSNSPRNFIAGANSVMPQAPVSFSCWIYLRGFNSTGFTQHLFAKQTNTGNWSSTFASVELQNRTYAGQSQQWDFFILPTNASATPIISVENTMLINFWMHVGLTWDGTTQIAYFNGNVVATATTTSTTINYGATPGPWFFGAIPSGSGNPEESIISVCDFRIANTVRPQSYFKEIYTKGLLNSGAGNVPLITYYKLRSYDTICNTPVYWVSTKINYSDAPSAPCGSLGPIEILETWVKRGFE